MKHALWHMLVLATLLAGASGAWGQATQGVVMRALDAPVELDIADAPISQGIEQLRDKTGLDVQLSPDALAMLPYGEQTRLRIKAANVRLRDALTAMLDPMCLQWRATDDKIIIEPTDALRRTVRRPTFSEVCVLARLGKARLEKGEPTIEQLRKAAALSELDFYWQVNDPARQAEAIDRAEARRPCSGAEYLEALTQGTDWTWYVWGNELVILPQTAQTQRQLQQRTTLRYQSQPLLNVLIDVAQKAHVKLQMDPGVLGLVPAATRESFTLLMADASLEQALEAISGATGLEFRPEKSTIRVSASDTLKASASQPVRPRIAFAVVLPISGPRGEQMYVMMRPDELPPEEAAKYQKIKDDYLEKAWQPYGGRPATQPADAPNP